MGATIEVWEYFDKIEAIISRGGPDVSEYSFITNVPKGIDDISFVEQQKMFEVLSPLLTKNSMIGTTFVKSHGYAGDYELIARIYDQWKSKDNNLYKWDLFYHEMEGAKAVRNRKSYFNHLANKTEKQSNSALVLNLGSGPCLDLYEFLKSKPKSKHTLKFECVDMDPQAIDYGSTVCDNYTDQVSFIRYNALKFDPGYKYDLIWSAGLFDYFNDRIFIRAVRKTYSLVKSGGELVIGNFSTYNPSRAVMENFGQWYLHHRSEDTLIDLAIKAGVPENLIKVFHEDTGVNLFLHLRKD